MQIFDVLLQRAGGSSGFGLYQIFALLILILDIVVIVSVWKSHKALIPKLVWTLVILFLPILGLILYFFLGREK